MRQQHVENGKVDFKVDFEIKIETERERKDKKRIQKVIKIKDQPLPDDRVTKPYI